MVAFASRKYTAEPAEHPEEALEARRVAYMEWDKVQDTSPSGRISCSYLAPIPQFPVPDEKRKPLYLTLGLLLGRHHLSMLHPPDTVTGAGLGLRLSPGVSRSGIAQSRALKTATTSRRATEGHRASPGLGMFLPLTLLLTQMLDRIQAKGCNEPLELSASGHICHSAVARDGGAHNAWSEGLRSGLLGLFPPQALRGGRQP